MSNSALVSYTKISPNRSSPRNRAIDTITIHCVVGQCSVETLGAIFAPTSRQASSNYGVGYDGKIGMYVEEKDRSWCTSSAANDNRAVTIEVASDTTEPYAVRPAAYNALIELVADICKRNGIKKLVWSTSKSDRVNHANGCNVTVHRDYANKSCPGNYLYERHADIVAKVNAKLGATTPATSETTGTPASTSALKIGGIVDFKGVTHYANANAATGVGCKPGRAKVTSVYASGKHPYHLVAEKGGGSTVYGWVNAADIATGTAAETFTPYVVKVTADVLNIRKGPGTNYGTNGSIQNGGAFTIVAESEGQGATLWGKLKSGAGWISLDYVKKI